ncbi:uncharacterized protein Ecym_1222 [Eremothecium cymbalariae DBVPG|uniref:ABC transporter domain-containing protein n=1 Tax=Eremothecium cymbalariae (strain CBS 270.75 / DBVPG 7215 / KCTC 17166 / NRRL Y-17582) TaxID=931890 RepID=G8JN05_ERECY|nr:hypothetical protein Ecym_1222 [Eremothecium cymbalariae DBVPG\
MALDSLSEQFNPIRDLCLTAKDSTICGGKRDAEYQGATAIHNITFRAEGGQVILLVGEKASQVLRRLEVGNSEVMVRPAESLRVNEYSYQDFAIRYPQQIIYDNGRDLHFEHLTVQQTVDFVVDCKFRCSRQAKLSIRDTLLSDFKLSHTRSALVGSEGCVAAGRGSGGISTTDRRKLSMIEAFLSRGSLYFWNDSTRGLDSSGALDFVQCLKRMARVTQTINLVNSTQAGEQFFREFDKILVIVGEYQVFYGSLDDCLEFFQSLKFYRDPNILPGEYVSAVAHGLLRSPLVNSDVDLHRYWVSSAYYKELCESIVDVEQKCNGVEHAASSHSPVSMVNVTKYCFVRAYRRTIANRFCTAMRLAVVLIQSLMFGLLFYDTPRNAIGSYSRSSLIFVTLVFFTVFCLADIPVSFAKRPVVAKQTKLHLYRPWMEHISSTFCILSFNWGLISLFSMVVYFLAHFQYDFQRFYTFFSTLLLTNFSMYFVFQTVAYVSPALWIARVANGIIVLVAVTHASYVIPLPSIGPLFKWIAYLNPLRYAMETMLSNELVNLVLDCEGNEIPRGPEYDQLDMSEKVCAWSGAKLGHAFVRGHEYLEEALSYSYTNTKRNYSILLGVVAWFAMTSLLSCEYITPIYAKHRFEDYYTRFKGRNSFLTVIISDQKAKAEQREDEVPDVSDEISSDSDCGSTIDERFIKSDILSHSISNSSSMQDVVLGRETPLVSWKKLTYAINGSHLINGVSGYFRPGLTAIIGESGSGKTTLLNILGGRIVRGLVTGEVLVNGKLISDKHTFRHNNAYVYQRDIHLGLLTVGETLEFSSSLRGDGDYTYVKKISKLLKLSRGRLVKDLSPAERKLLSIGIELSTKPSLALLLDEPFSGLDPPEAASVMGVLRTLAKNGFAIICTLHQPSKYLFDSFENVVILNNSGECVYFGYSRDAIGYFGKVADMLCEGDENPADLILDAVEHTHGTIDWAKLWAQSSEKVLVEEARRFLETHAAKISYIQNPVVKRSLPMQLLLVTKRQFLLISRDNGYLFLKVAFGGIIGSFIGLTYWKQDGTIASMQNILFAVFTSLCVWYPFARHIHVKALETKELYLAREMKANTFFWPVMIVAQFIVELPATLLSAVIFYLTFYFSLRSGALTSSANVMYLLNFLLFGLYQLTFGLLVAFSCTDLQTSGLFSGISLSLMSCFCGVIQPFAIIPVFWKLIYRVSPYTYFMDSLVSLLLHNRNVECHLYEMTPALPTVGQTCREFLSPHIALHGGYLVNPDSDVLCNYCMYSKGDDFLAKFNMSYSHLWRNMIICVLFICFNIIATFGAFYLFSILKAWKPFQESLQRALDFATLRTTIRRTIRRVAMC